MNYQKTSAIEGRAMKGAPFDFPKGTPFDFPKGTPFGFPKGTPFGFC
jgi:hypothetical protein